MILQQPVAREQMTKLLATGATDLLEGFVSNKTRRKFKARLAWDAKEGKVVFAFEPRPERKPVAKKGAGPVRIAATVAPVADAAAVVDDAPAKKAPVRKVTAVRKVAGNTLAKKKA